MAVLNNDFWIEFFDEYRNCPELWNSTSDSYKNKNKRNTALLKLLDIYKNIDKNATIASLKNKIHNIRTCYRRELKKVLESEKSRAGADEIYEPALWYFDTLDFLKDIKIPAVGTTSHASDNEVKEEVEEVQPYRKRKCMNNKNDAEIFAEGWAISFKKLSEVQKLYAKKAIDEILLLGQLNQLSLHNVTHSPICSNENSPFRLSRSSTKIIAPKMDLSKACRLCLFENGFKSISSSNSDNISYFEMINYCTGLNVKPTDSYPNSICLICEELLLKLYHFREQIIIANARLDRMIFVKVKSDMEVRNNNNDDMKFQNSYLLCDNTAESCKSDTINEECLPKDHYWENISEIHFNNEIEIGKQMSNISNLSPEKYERNTVEGIDKVETVKNDNKSLNKRKYKKPSKKNFRELCLVCGKLINNLSAHAKTHMNPEDRPKNHICTICNRGFCIKNNLTTHMRKHTDEKRYECEYCGKKFRVWSSRRHHIYREHTGQFRFTCHICDKKFIQTSSYNSHLLRHTGEKPEKCDICDKTFVTKDLLKNHQVSHISEKNHMCEICHKLYKSLKSLREHMKIHNDERNYNCPVCSQAFIQNHVLRTHVRKKHPDYELPPPGTIVSQKAIRRQQEELAKKNLMIKIPNNNVLVDRDKTS